MWNANRPLLLQARSCSRSWRRWMIKPFWSKFSCWKARRTTRSATCPKPAQPWPQPGPPPTPSTVPQSCRPPWTCSQVRRASHQGRSCLVSEPFERQHTIVQHDCRLAAMLNASFYCIIQMRAVQITTGHLCLLAALDGNSQAVSSLSQESSTQRRRRTGRRPTPTSLRPLRATTPSTAPEPSQHLNTCSCVK